MKRSCESAQTILPIDYASLVLSSPTARRCTSRRSGDCPMRAVPRPRPRRWRSATLKQDTVQVFRRGEFEALGPPVEALLALRLRSACSLPLATAQGTVGVIDVGSTNPSAFSEDDVTLLSQLSTYVAIAIQNARSFEEIRR